MKRTVACLLLLALLCLCLCSCGAYWGYKKGKSFSADFLKSVSLEDMPLPQVENYAVNTNTEGRQTLKFDTNLRDLEAYINTFVAYMNARDDIYYFGIQKSEGSLAEILPHEVTYKIDDFDWESSYFRYVFSYSLTDQLDKETNCFEHHSYENCILIKFEYDREEKNVAMCITTNGAFASECIDTSFYSLPN